MFESVLNPVLSPLLRLDPWLGILIISLIISFVMTIAYKYLTDQDLMKRLKSELKDLQKEAKELRSHPEKAMRVQKQMMETNMKYMMQSFKPTLFTIIPLIIIFGWLSSNMGYQSIVQDNEFTVAGVFDPTYAGNATLSAAEGIEIVSAPVQSVFNGEAKWTLKGKAGKYLLNLQFSNDSYDKKITITENIDVRAYDAPIEKVKGKVLKTITVSNEKIIALNLFGWKIGWLGTYIIYSIIFSMLLRKILKIY